MSRGLEQKIYHVKQFDASPRIFSFV